MAMTNFEQLMAPILNAFGRGETLSTAEIRARIAKAEKLSDEQLRERYATGVPVFLNQAGWAIHCLHRAGLLEQVRRGIYQLSSSGKKLRAEKRETISTAFLKTRYPQYKKWRQNAKPETRTRAGSSAAGAGETADSLTPMDRLEEAHTEIQRMLESELHRLMQEEITPAMFERIAVDLLKAMGYGKDHADSAEVTGGPNDRGIDGVIKEDALGLSKIYVQAKKYSARYAVSGGKLREFAEALRVKRATKGVFVTTSKFAPGAKKDYAERDDIVLIDGEELVRLMIRYEVGVARKDYAIKRIDENYFAEEGL